MSFSTTGQSHSKTPPLRGVFTLDHDGECQPVVAKYLRCLKKNSSLQDACRGLAKEYFECRMQHGLMKREEWASLGYGDLVETKAGTEDRSRLQV